MKQSNILTKSKTERLRLRLAAVQYVKHTHSEPWGTTVHLTECAGRAYGCVYWYFEEPSIVYLSSLSVDVEYRKLGLGTDMQQTREDIGRQRGAKIARLAVYANTWMHSWYLRRGYVFEIADKSEEGLIWLSKDLSLKK